MNSELTIVKDANGNFVVIPIEHLWEAFEKGVVSLFGIDKAGILALKEAYQRRGGIMPITKDRVNELFGV